ncbi:unnamed protein product [Dovyalis caffra]|uniref:Dirigent protein n=1 Tax=Dovyalis caffra TaxID=77055 RepID=A0AAV1SD84_9ROSI|nr:unnamed protein product [Dovyalis caffra]
MSHQAILASFLSVAGKAGKLWSFTQFGTTFVTYDPVTETSDPKSAPVGRAQGIYASLEGLNLHFMISIVFTSEAYNCSTMEIQGNSKQFEALREVFIVSRTGMFRYARVYATFETYYLDIPAGHSIIRCYLSVLHCQEYHGV